jgi:large subunit ribosomal protein L25
MATNIEVTVENRKPGKHFSRGLRKAEKIPAVVYGPKIKNLMISLPQKEVEKYNKLAFENSIFVFKSTDPQLNNLKVLKKDVVVHPVTRRPLHLDFYALDLTKAVRVFVEIRFTGRSAGVKEGGVLNAVRRDVEIECLPTAIPQFLALDVTDVGLGDSLHCSDLVIPEGMKLITLPTETLCAVSIVEEIKAAPVVAAVDPAAAAAPAAGAAAAPGAAPAKDAKAEAPAKDAKK